MLKQGTTMRKRFKYDQIFKINPEKVKKLENDPNIFSSGFKILIPPKLKFKDPSPITKKDEDLDKKGILFIFSFQLLVLS